ncbi:MAG: VOC family protein [Pseudomonadota bacterium]
MFSHVSFTSIPVADLDRALAFYRDVVGCEVVMDDAGAFGRWVMLGIPGARTRIQFDVHGPKPGTTPGTPHPRPALVLAAPDVEEAVETLASRGATVAAPAGPAEWNAEVTRAMIADSEGNLILIADRAP